MDRRADISDPAPQLGPSRIVVDDRAVLRWQLTVIGTLLAVSTVFQVLLRAFPDARILPLPASLTFVDGEGTVPALYATLALGLAAILLVLAGRAARSDGDPDARHWWFLAGVFGILAIDESLAVHERTMDPLRSALGIEGGPLWFAWIIPASIGLVVLGLILLGFLRRLPVDTRRRFLLSGALFVVGAIGVEALGGAFASIGDDETARLLSPGYVVITTVEEAFEFVGVALFNASIVRHLRHRRTPWGVRIELAPAD